MMIFFSNLSTKEQNICLIYLQEILLKMESRQCKIALGFVIIGLALLVLFFYLQGNQSCMQILIFVIIR